MKDKTTLIKIIEQYEDTKCWEPVSQKLKKSQAGVHLTIWAYVTTASSLGEQDKVCFSLSLTTEDATLYNE